MPTYPNRPWRRACLTLACAAALIRIGSIPALAQTEPSVASTPPASAGIDSVWQQHANEPDLSWRDPTSHSRVVCVSRGLDSAELSYFHQNVFTAEGDLMLFNGRRGKEEGYYVLDLRTGEIRQLSHQVGENLVVLPHRRSAAFRRGDDVFLMSLDSGQVRTILTVPHDLLAASAGFGFTADESKLLFAQCDELEATGKRVTSTPQKDIHMRRLDFVIAYEKMPKHNAIYSIDIDSGKLTPVFKDEEGNWLGHVQGSTTNPNLALFIHEGFVSVHILNRLRLLDLTTGQVTMPRTGALEKDGITHEFWDRDGHSIWYDISTAGALARLDSQTGVETRYVYRNASSVHANQSIHYAIGPGGRWAVGDGFQNNNNNWLYLYQLSQRDPQTQVVPVVRICDFAPTYLNPNAAYIEPNPHLTPDARWVLFTAHLKGNANQVYAVEIPATAVTGN